MPIYEFKCNVCAAEFEQLCKVSWQGTVKCPNCSSENVKKMLSMFSSAIQGGTTNCSGCSGKSCGNCK